MYQFGVRWRWPEGVRGYGKEKVDAAKRLAPSGKSCVRPTAQRFLRPMLKRASIRHAGAVAGAVKVSGESVQYRRVISGKCSVIVSLH